MNKEMKLKEEALDDIYEIWNNLLDDLTLDFEDAENGYGTYKESYEAIKKYTEKVIEQKARKWRNRVPIKNLIEGARKEMRKTSLKGLMDKDYAKTTNKVGDKQ